MLLVPASNPTGIVQKLLVLRYSKATGMQTSVGAVGPKVAMAAAMDVLIDSGYDQAEYTEEYGGIATVRATYNAGNLSDPSNPTSNEQPEIVWELIGSDETSELDRTDNGKRLEKAVPGILLAVESCVEKYKSAITSKELWEQTTNDGSTVDVAGIATAISAAYTNAIAVLNQMCAAAGPSYQSSATTLFEWKAKGVSQFMFTRYSLRKSMTFSGYKSSIAQDIIAGINENQDRYFTSSLLLSRETSIPATLAYSIPRTYTDSISGLEQGYYLKHVPHSQVSANGRTTLSVEYAYTPDLCKYAYEAAI